MNREEAIYFANCLKNNYTVDLDDMEAFCDMAIKALAQEPTTKNNSSELEKNSKKLEKGTAKNDLGVEEVTALAEWTEKLTKASEDAYNKGYADGMKAQEPRKGHLSIDDVMSVFDDFMCGEVDEDGTTTFLEMLKDKAERTEE